MEKKIPLIVIVGPTSSGKTSLAIDIAKKFNCEIVSADSMQIYKDMDIATAKPSLEDRKEIVHHCIDFLDCSEPFNVSNFIKMADYCINDIYGRSKIPILVGGTGLYINSLIDGINFPEFENDYNLREKIELRIKIEGIDKIYKELKKIDPIACEKIHPNNKMRIIRALEILEKTGKTITEYNNQNKTNISRYNLCMIGLNYKDRKLLYENINIRVDDMIKSGLLDEAKKILDRYDTKTACQAIGYKELSEYFCNKMTLQDAIENIKRETRRYAKRQITWFKRDERIKWIYIDEFDKKSFIFKNTEKIIENFLKT